MEGKPQRSIKPKSTVDHKLVVEKLVTMMPLIETFDSRIKNMEEHLSKASPGEILNVPTASSSAVSQNSCVSTTCSNLRQLEETQSENRNLRTRIEDLEKQVKASKEKKRKSAVAPGNAAEVGGFVCKACGKPYMHQKTLLRHLKLHQRLFECSKCGTGYDRQCNLDVHNRKPCKGRK